LACKSADIRLGLGSSRPFSYIEAYAFMGAARLHNTKGGSRGVCRRGDENEVRGGRLGRAAAVTTAKTCPFWQPNLPIFNQSAINLLQIFTSTNPINPGLCDNPINPI
jgi:hypothetical protein